MPHREKLDDYFEKISAKHKNTISSYTEIYTKKIRRAKILLPLVASFFIGLLLTIPKMQDEYDELRFDITKPKYGELEKLHVENTVFNITDKDNKVSQFYTKNIDETEPQSKLIKLNEPTGIINASEENWIDVKSSIGYFDQNKNTLTLEDNIDIMLSQGMVLKTKEALIDFNENTTTGNNPVSAFGIYGDVDSEGFLIKNKENIVIFKGKTRVKIKETPNAK